MISMGDLYEELKAWLDTKAITSDNIGTIRRQCFVPWASQWNGIVRDETANRENKPAVYYSNPGVLEEAPTDK